MTYIALLRGINVGGKNKIEMPRLCACFEEAGMHAVRNYINTGNIIFTAPEAPRQAETPHQPTTPNPAERQHLQKRLESAIEEHFALKIPVLLRSYPEMQTLLQSLPEDWHNDKLMKSDILFLWDSIDEPSIVQAVNPREGVDRVIYTAGALLWSVDRSQQTKSALIKLVSNKIYKQMTVRNVNTLRAVWALMREVAENS